MDDINGHHFNLLELQEEDISSFKTPNMIKLNEIYQYTIKNQGIHNSCIINATITLIEYLRQIQGLPYMVLSTSFLYHFSAKENGKYKNGIKTISVLKSLLTHGVCEQKRWTSVFDVNIKPSYDAIVDALSRISDTTIEIIPNSLNVIKYVLGYCKRPIVAILPLSDEESVPNHSVVLVGYDDNQESIIFQNSYGLNWGDNGFGYLPYSLISNIVKMFSMDETCVKAFEDSFEQISNPFKVIEK